MRSRPWLQNVRFCAGVLLAPALVPLALHTSLKLSIAHLGPSANDLSAQNLRVFVLTIGVGMVYLAVLCLGVPYVGLLRRAGRLNFRTILGPTLVLSWVYAVVVYASLQGDYPFAGAVAACCLPAVILSGLAFYLIAFWRSPQDDAPISPLLVAYPAGPKPTVPV